MLRMKFTEYPLQYPYGYAYPHLRTTALRNKEGQGGSRRDE